MGQLDTKAAVPHCLPLYHYQGGWSWNVWTIMRLFLPLSSLLECLQCFVASITCPISLWRQIRTFVRVLINVMDQNYIPAQISEGLKIQLLHLLLAEPVADPTASQEGLHLHGEGTAATEASTCAVGGENTGCRAVRRVGAAQVHHSIDMVATLLQHDRNHKRRLSILNHVSCLVCSKAIIIQVANETLHCSASVFCTQKPPPC